MLDENRQDEEGLCCEALAELEVSEVDDLEESQTELPNEELAIQRPLWSLVRSTKSDIKKFFSNA